MRLNMIVIASSIYLFLELFALSSYFYSSLIILLIHLLDRVDSEDVQKGQWVVRLGFKATELHLNNVLDHGRHVNVRERTNVILLALDLVHHLPSGVSVLRHTSIELAHTSSSRVWLHGIILQAYLGPL